MVNRNHKYKVVGKQSVIYMTYDDFGSARQFVDNASKAGRRLQVEPNDPITKLVHKHRTAEH